MRAAKDYIGMGLIETAGAFDRALQFFNRIQRIFTNCDIATFEKVPGNDTYFEKLAKRRWDRGPLERLVAKTTGFTRLNI